VTPELPAQCRFVGSVAVALGGVLLGSETMQALLTAAAGIPFCRPSFARATEKKTT
jgi:hypothetical protein